MGPGSFQSQRRCPRRAGPHGHSTGAAALLRLKMALALACLFVGHETSSLHEERGVLAIDEVHFGCGFAVLGRTLELNLLSACIFCKFTYLFYLGDSDKTMTLYILLIIIVISLIVGTCVCAQIKISGTYRRYARIPSRSGITGREAAHYVMQNAGVNDVEIVAIRGHLTDHYDPIKKRLALSEENYVGTSLAALGVAAHEAGHAIQHAVGYKALQLRMSLIPITNIASKLLPIVIIGGIWFHIFGLIKLGVLVYLVLTVFQLVTLPVEFDASRRAKLELSGLGIIAADEMPGVTKTLNAAGWTYVAAFIASLANLIYLIFLARGRG